MNGRRSLVLAIHGLQFITGIAFVVAGWKSDRALDKSGVGDPEIFDYWSRIAGVSFWLFMMLWITGSIIILLILRKERQESIIKLLSMNLINKSSIGIWLPPILLFFGWVLTIL
jgi:hypothetical protein